MTEGSHTYRVTNNGYEHRCAPIEAHEARSLTGRRITAQWIIWNGGTEEWSIYDDVGPLMSDIRFCPLCGTELPPPPQPPRVVSGSWREWDEVREAIAYAVSKGHAPPALIGKIMIAADWSQQPEPAQTEEDRQAWLARVTS